LKGIILEIERMNKGEWGKIRAFFDMKTEEGFILKGFKLINGTNGMFVGFPSQKGQDDQYYDTIYADKELKEQVNQAAMKYYGGDIMTGGYDQSAGFNQAPPANDAPPVDDAAFDDDIPF
jgi:DNA-binding cell septation regulator SpoVG